MKLTKFIKINPADSVVVCLKPFTKGETIKVDNKTITILQDTPAQNFITRHPSWNQYHQIWLSYWSCSKRFKGRTVGK